MFLTESQCHFNGGTMHSLFVRYKWSQQHKLCHLLKSVTPLSVLQYCDSTSRRIASLLAALCLAGSQATVRIAAANILCMFA
jgi:hypothetical protein